MVLYPGKLGERQEDGILHKSRWINGRGGARRALGGAAAHMPVVVGAGGRANYYCGTCRQSGIGEAFRLQHALCENVEALQFTATNSSAEPDTLEDILKELEAAEKDDALIVPDLEFVHLGRPHSTVRRIACRVQTHA